MVDKSTKSKTNHVYVWGDIDDELGYKVYRRLQYLENSDFDEIKVFVQSTGGDVDIASAITDKMDEISYKKAITTICCGRAYSAGAIIYVHGTLRLSYPNSSFLFHPCSYQLPEDYHELQKQYVGFAEDQYSRIIDDVCTICKMKRVRKKTFIEKTKSSFWMDTDTAIQYGVVHKKIGV